MGGSPFIPSPRPPPGNPPPHMPSQQLGPAGAMPIPGLPLHQQAAMLGRSPPHGPAVPGMYGSPGACLTWKCTSPPPICICLSPMLPCSRWGGAWVVTDRMF